jgi:hypothetical protein
VVVAKVVLDVSVVLLTVVLDVSVVLAGVVLEVWVEVEVCVWVKVED